MIDIAPSHGGIHMARTMHSIVAMKKTNPSLTCHPESPCRIPLVRQMLADPQVRLVPRPMDGRWRRWLNGCSAGFNGFSGSIDCPAHSPLAQWLDKPYESARHLNEDDGLMGDLLFAVHDDLHVWSYLAIRSIMPKIGFGTA